MQDTPRQEGGSGRLGARTDTALDHLRRQAYEIVEGGRGSDPAANLFDSTIVALILLNVTAFAAETVPSLQTRYGAWFDVFEMLSVIVFTAEYAVRLWTAVEVPFLRRTPRWKARLTWATRPYLIIDLMAILPFYLGQLFALDLRILRVLRLLRFLKLSRYSPAIHTLVRVLNNERRALMAAGLLLLAAVLLASTGIYYLEQEAQPDKFGSVPESAWWAIATLTTVGYGDVAPITPLGRLFGGVVMVCGLCILALPVAIIATGFAQEVSRRDFVVTWSLMSRIPLLAELEAKDVAEIMPLLHAHNLPPKAEVIPAGAQATAMYFVASGRVQLLTPNGEISFATGEFFGVVSMLGNDVARGPYRTVGKCRLLKLYKHDFHRLEASNPTVAAHIRKVALDRQLARETGRTAEGDTSQGRAV